jgi:hypothetical protein
MLLARCPATLSEKICKGFLLKPLIFFLGELLFEFLRDLLLFF